MYNDEQFAKNISEKQMKWISQCNLECHTLAHSCKGGGWYGGSTQGKVSQRACSVLETAHNYVYVVVMENLCFVYVHVVLVWTSGIENGTNTIE